MPGLDRFTTTQNRRCRKEIQRCLERDIRPRHRALPLATIPFALLYLVCLLRHVR